MTTVHISWKLRAWKAEAALRKILAYKQVLDGDSCDNPGAHAACLDRFSNEVEKAIQDFYEHAPK